MGLNLKHLKGADAKGFDAIPAGSYDAVVYEAKERNVKADTQGSLPPGTPGVAVQFKIDGGEYDNRRVFTNYWMPPADYDAQKAQVMNNIFAAFLKGVGFDEDEITSGKLQLEYEDLEDRECRITVKVSENGQNQVSAVRPRSEVSAGSSLL